jgi:hypothetical protein
LLSQAPRGTAAAARIPERSPRARIRPRRDAHFRRWARSRREASCERPRHAEDRSHYLATTAGAGTEKGSCTGGGAPEAVLSLPLGQKSDLRVTVTPETKALDLGVYLRPAACDGGSELACVESAASGEPETLAVRDLAAGAYVLVVDGFGAQDAGAFQVDIDLRLVVAVGTKCDVGGVVSRCDDGASCVGPAATAVCKTHTVLLEEGFDLDLGAMTVIDALGDGNGWGYCDPVLGCTQDNSTGSLSGGGFALVKDKANAVMKGEVLRTPLVNTTGFGKVLLSFDHDFDHWDAATDLASVQVSKDGAAWTTVASYTEDATGSVQLDLSAVGANGSVMVRFVFDDQTAGGDALAEEWRVDDVRIVGIP